MDAMVSKLRASGATVVSISEQIYNSSTISGNLDVQKFKFRELMDLYLQGESLGGSHPSSLSELNTESKTSNLPLRATFKTHSLGAFIYPEQQKPRCENRLPQSGGMDGILGALTGLPVVTIPAGFSTSSKDAPNGVPIGMEILGLLWTDLKLLNIARRIEQLGKVRPMPKFVSLPGRPKKCGVVPTIIPNLEDIPEEYAIGKLGNE
ncbi:hypothetical protein PAAG_11938 [Paracoccidioides lutzii Pb01]|uniref:Amidase domain-containing protein n=1 Tax=Paracoccidioides lutzii (strain ATCC MYA-826 / Pb01) TaxID=502779 RepID=A0A0A2V5D2_PARBA|nr:hypothetical protein PAAG_11938 [Paracoccidioides lutzii Pb01]KGQ01360.1 hypothetical protein PAAG_11938 [Paracoccidioides lutzii Pb01]